MEPPYGFAPIQWISHLLELASVGSNPPFLAGVRPYSLQNKSRHFFKYWLPYRHAKLTPL